MERQFGALPLEKDAREVGFKCKGEVANVIGFLIDELFVFHMLHPICLELLTFHALVLLSRERAGKIHRQHLEQMRC